MTVTIPCLSDCLQICTKLHCNPCKTVEAIHCTNCTMQMNIKGQVSLQTVSWVAQTNNDYVRNMYTWCWSWIPIWQNCRCVTNLVTKTNQMTNQSPNKPPTPSKNPYNSLFRGTITGFVYKLDLLLKANKNHHDTQLGNFTSTDIPKQLENFTSVT